MALSWSHLIRFITNGSTVYGDAIFPPGTAAQDIVSIAKSGNLKARLIEGDPIASEATITDKELLVEKLLCPLSRDQVPIIRCIGLNYMAHIREGGRTPPPYPSIFIKPSTSLAGFEDDILIPKLAQVTLDYEGELTIVIGRAGRDIAEDDVLDHIAGYVCSNDLSCRLWQKDPNYAGNVPQWCFSKGFDSFAPIGPMIVSPKVVGAADNLQLKTLVNSEVRQETNTSDLLFGIKKIVAFASQGTTLEAGTLIMTGTPSGVAMGMMPPRYLSNGDYVHVSISGLGSLQNRIVFE